MLFVDVKKAHLVPLCHEDVYIELPNEAGPNLMNVVSCSTGSTAAARQARRGKTTTHKFYAMEALSVE